MEYITFESFPEGADLEIEGEPCGQTPADIEMFSDLISFREECMTEGNVSCGWETLKTRLEDQTVSKIWWDLLTIERKAIALMTTSNVLHFRIFKWRLGQDNCAGGEGDWENANCGINSMVRVWKLGTEAPDSYNAYWQEPATQIEYCYVPAIKYNLPCYLATIEMGHLINALQIGEDASDINNWVFAQYTETNIIPGMSWQLPIPTTVTIAACDGTLISTIHVE